MRLGAGPGDDGAVQRKSAASLERTLTLPRKDRSSAVTSSQVVTLDTQEQASGAYTLTCDTAGFTLAGQDTTLTADRTLTLETNGFTLAVQDVTFSNG